MAKILRSTTKLIKSLQAKVAKAPVEEPIKPKAKVEEQREPQETEESKEAGETGGEMTNITKVEEIWSQSSMAMPQRNSQHVGPGESNTAEDQDSEGPALTPSSLILTMLRTGRRGS